MKKSIEQSDQERLEKIIPSDPISRIEIWEEQAFAAIAAMVNSLAPPAAPNIAGRPNADSACCDGCTWKVSGWEINYAFNNNRLFLTWTAPDDVGYWLYRDGKKKHTLPDVEEYQNGWPDSSMPTE